MFSTDLPSTSSQIPSTSHEQQQQQILGCKPFTETLPFCTPADQQMLLHFAEREFVLFSFWKTGSAMGKFSLLFESDTSINKNLES